MEQKSTATLSKVTEISLSQNCYLCKSDVPSQAVNRVSLRNSHREPIILSICGDCQRKYLTLGVALVNPENDSAIVLTDEAYSALFSEPIPKERIIHVREEILEQIYSLFLEFKEYENRLALGEIVSQN